MIVVMFRAVGLLHGSLGFVFGGGLPEDEHLIGRKFTYVSFFAA